MRLSWNEIRVRAAIFAKEWHAAAYEKGETQSFYNEFFEVFGKRRRDVARYEEHVKKIDNRSGFIDLFWPGVLVVEQKSAGRDLEKAYGQAGEYFDALRERERPRYILVSDFQTFTLRDLSLREEASFALADLPQHIDKFGFILGVQKRSFKDQDPVNIKAAELVGNLHDRLEESGFTGHDLERFLVRIVFCLFADDTGVFEPRDIFLEWLNERTAEDGSDLGPKLAQLFQVLDTPEDKRGKHLDEDMARFPYVNGELFGAATRIPTFDTAMRNALMFACEFDWTPISPAIFGSLFQSVMDKAERRKQGAHYTTEKNIMKVIGPLFLDDLWAEFERAKALKRGKRPALSRLHDKLAELTFFDPACGCGNFLIIAYRELRRLEIAILKETLEGTQLDLDAARFSRINVDQFYGIEIGEFPAEIARAAMWMMDHIMNNELSLAFGQNYARIPLVASPHIHCPDALEIDWGEVINPERCSYIFGNPPFVGAKYQSKEQRQQVREIAKLGGSGGTLDYVAAWFIKAGEFANRTKRPIRIGFVATNSITQGEQVAQLWPILFDRFKLEIAFAHRTFAWGSDARGKAHVHVVIIGLTKRDDEVEEKRLFSYDHVNGEAAETRHSALSPYLFDASRLPNPKVLVREAPKPITDMPRLISGTQPLEGGFLTFDDEQKAFFLESEPGAASLMRPFPGASEFIKGISRWILHTRETSPAELRAMPAVVERLKKVRDFRAKSTRKTTLRLAKSPSVYGVDVVPEEPFVVMPQVSSERREYAPIAWLEPPIIPSEKLRILLKPELFHFAILTSAIHMAWMRTVTGRLKSDYMYSVGVVYNTFPWPELTDKAKATLTETGQAILDARAAHPDATLADLYDPDAMPPALRKAHRDNDRAVDRLYRKKPFESERERVEHLFMLYEKLKSPLTAPDKKPKRRRRKKSKSAGA